MDRVLHYQWRVSEILALVFMICSFPLLLSLLIGWFVLGVVRACRWALRGSRRLEAIDNRLDDILVRLGYLSTAIFGAGLAVGLLGLVLPWALVAVGLFAAVTKLMFRVVPEREPIINSEGSSREEHGSGVILREWWDRIISLRTMDVPLRLITLLTIAQLIASGVLLVRYHSSLSPVVVDTYLGHDVRMDSLVFGTCLVFLVLAWSLVLTGASFRWTWSTVLILAFMGVTWPPLANRPQLMPWLGLTAAIWAWWLTMLWGNRRPSSHFHWAYRFFTMAVLLAAYYSLTYDSSASVDTFRQMITRQVFGTSLFLVPVLFLTGTDFAELSEWLALLTRHLVAPVKFAGWWAVVTAAAAASNLYVAIPKATESRGLRVLVVGAVITATVLAAGKLFRTDAPSRWFQSGVVVKTTLAAFKVMAVLVLFSVGGGSLIYLSYSLDFVPADALLAFLLLGVCGAVLSEVLDPEPAATSHLRAVRVPFAALALIAVFLTGTHEGTTLLEGTWGDPVGTAADIPFTVFHNDVEGSRFSMTYPEGWKWGQGPDGRGGEVRSGLRDEDAGRILLISRETSAVRFYWNSRSERRGLTLARSMWPFLASANVDDLIGSQNETKAGPWFRSAYRYFEAGRNYHFWIFIRESGAETLLLVAICPERYTHFYEPVLMAMIESWRPDLTATPADTVHHHDPLKAAVKFFGLGIVPMLLVPVGFVLLYAYGGQFRPSENPRHVVGLFAILSGVTAFCLLPGGTITELGGPTTMVAQPLSALQVLVGAFSLLLVLAMWARRVVRDHSSLLKQLLQLNVGVLLLSLIYALYARAIAASEERVMYQALVLVAALTWDLMMSGREITNVDGHAFRRPARVLLYAGYLMLVSSTILYYSAQNVAGVTERERFFDAEDLVRQGIVWLGSPLLLLGFLLRTRADWSSLWNHFAHGKPKHDMERYPGSH